MDRLANRELSGNAAKLAVTDMLMTIGDERERRAFLAMLNRNLDCGVDVSTVNKAVKGAIEKFAVMLSHPFDPMRVKKWPVFIEPKYDGVRVIAKVTREGVVQTLSRSGKEFTAFDSLKEDISKIGLEIFAKQVAVGNCTAIFLDGEVTSGSFNETVSSARKKDTDDKDAIYHVFDAFALADGVYFSIGENAEERREVISRYIGKDGRVRLIQRLIASNESEVNNITSAWMNMGLEGSIVKLREGEYQFKRSYNWMKIKAEETIDVKVIGFFEGLGKYQNQLGGFIVDVDGVSVNIGGGFTDEQRKEFWELRESMPGRMIEVEYHQKTPDGSLRHPRFIRFRDAYGEHGTKE